MTKNKFRIISFERVLAMVYNKLEGEIEGLELDDVRSALYIHFALVRSVIDSNNYRSMRIKHFGQFGVRSTTVFSKISTLWKKVLKGWITKEEFDKGAEETMIHFQEVRDYKASKYYDFTIQQCVDYAEKTFKPKK